MLLRDRVIDLDDAVVIVNISRDVEVLRRKTENLRLDLIDAARLTGRAATRIDSEAAVKVLQNDGVKERRFAVTLAFVVREEERTVLPDRATHRDAILVLP